MNMQNTDKELKKLFKEYASIQPPDNFTNQVLQSIESRQTEKAVNYSFFKQDFSIGIIAGLLAITGIIYILIFTDGAMVWSEYDPIMYPIFKNIWINLKEAISSIKVSSVTIVIIAGIVSLFMAERLIRKIQSNRSSINLL